MSYVEVGTTTLSYGSNSNEIGNLSVKNISAGFVHTNSGTIKQAYVHMAQFGQNQNEFSGFVLDNSGTVSESYTFINNGIKFNTTNMFAPDQSKGIVNCIEIKSDENVVTNVEDFFS